MLPINQRAGHSVNFSNSKRKNNASIYFKICLFLVDCGVQSTHGPYGLKVLSKMATHGDWPWHVTLFKEDVHICDGTLVAPEWVATTTSCFQGQPKAEWIARFAVTRLLR